jgi:hypothetical protein
MARVPEIDEVLTAEIVEDESDSFSARLRRLEEAKQAAAKAQAEAAEKQKRAGAGRSTGPDVAVSLAGGPAGEIIRLLRRPAGIRQAILLREILDRPEHRW